MKLQNATNLAILYLGNDISEKAADEIADVLFHNSNLQLQITCDTGNLTFITHN